MDRQPSALDTFFMFVASLVLEAMVFPSVAEGLRKGDSSAKRGEQTSGALRWFVRILLVPVEIVAHLMTFIGIGVGVIWGGIAFAACIVYIVLAGIQFLNSGTLMDPRLLLDYLAGSKV